MTTFGNFDIETMKIFKSIIFHVNDCKNFSEIKMLYTPLEIGYKLYCITCNKEWFLRYNNLLNMSDYLNLLNIYCKEEIINIEKNRIKETILINENETILDLKL